MHSFRRFDLHRLRPSATRTSRASLFTCAVLLLGMAWLAASGTSTAQRENPPCYRGEHLLAADSPSAPFPGTGDDSAPSIGKFRIAVAPQFRSLLEGMPGYDAASGNLDSPVMYDRQTTIGRSAPLVNGSAADEGGVPVGTAGVMVSDRDFKILPDPATFPDVPGAREIHTAVKRFTLKGTIAGMTVVEVRAGTDFPGLPLSPGEVRSQSTSGAPGSDLPGRSFFNIYVEVDLPPNPTQPLTFPGATLHNADPLLIVNDAVDMLPPRVVYTHEGPQAVPILFSADNGKAWSAGDLLGHLTLAGHGMCFYNTPEDITRLEQALAQHPGIPTPAPTATETPVPTDTPLPTTTDTPVPTATDTPVPTITPTSTPRPAPLYLPMLLHERCEVDARHVDVALVIDTSSSMAGAPIAAAREAALAFVAAAQLGGGDRVAVVTFHGVADLALPLTGDQHRAEAAIQSLDVTGTGTAIDAGLRLAVAELGGTRRQARSAPLLVLLTDGRQGGGPAHALEAAAEARQAGVTIYAIGLGPDVDAATLRAMAGDDSRFFLSPTPAELRRIYTDLAQEILCPGRRFWPSGR